MKEFEVTFEAISEKLKGLPYPRANFVTNPAPDGFPLNLEVVDDLDLAKLKLTLKEGKEEDYFLNPHLYISRLNLWISDGHRYLPAMTALLKYLGDSQDKNPGKILSIDLDYFSRFAESSLLSESLKLLTGACEAARNYDLVIADLHEDISGLSHLTRPELNYQDVVTATDKGQIRDENFIHFMGIERTLIVKPPLLEFFPTLGERNGILVANPDQLITEHGGVLHCVKAFDMIHICTSPGYIGLSRAFKVLELIHRQLYSEVRNS